MTIDPRAMALVGQAVAKSDPDDPVQVQAFVTRTLPRLPAAIRGLIFDFLVAADRIPSQPQLDALSAVIGQQLAGQPARVPPRRATKAAVRQDVAVHMAASAAAGEAGGRAVALAFASRKAAAKPPRHR